MPRFKLWFSNIRKHRHVLVLLTDAGRICIFNSKNHPSNMEVPKNRGTQLIKVMDGHNLVELSVETTVVTWGIPMTQQSPGPTTALLPWPCLFAWSDGMRKPWRRTMTSCASSEKGFKRLKFYFFNGKSSIYLFPMFKKTYFHLSQNFSVVFFFVSVFTLTFLLCDSSAPLVLGRFPWKA